MCVCVVVGVVVSVGGGGFFFSFHSYWSVTTNNSVHGKGVTGKGRKERVSWN